MNNTAVSHETRRLAGDTAKRPSPTKKLLWVFTGYLAFYLALFAQFPLQNALPGNADTLMGVVFSNIRFANMVRDLGLGAMGTSMYPLENVLSFGEASPGLMWIFLFFKLLGAGDVTAYYLWVVSVFSLTAAAAYVFAGLFIQSTVARVFSGFAFTCSNLAFARLDEAYAFVYVLPLLSLTFLTRGFREQNTRFLYLACALAASQIYFSVYIFAYQMAVFGGFGLYEIWRGNRLPRMAAFKAAAIFVVLVTPHLLFYGSSVAQYNVISPSPTRALTMLMSWNYHHLFQALPGNLLYGSTEGMPLTWDVARQQNLIGLLVFVSAFYALFRRGDHRLLLGGTAIVGFVLSLGPMIMLGVSTRSAMPPAEFYQNFMSSALFPAPLYPFYELLPGFELHRIPGRAYTLVLLAVSVLAGVTLQALLQKFSRRGVSLLIVIAFFGVHFLENVPFPMPAYRLGQYLAVPSAYGEFLEGKQDALILDLPSDIGHAYPDWDPRTFRDPYRFLYADDSLRPPRVYDLSSFTHSYQDVFHYNRELLYMNWQAQHRQNIVGGVHAYFPAPRLIFDRWLQDLPSESVLHWLREQRIDYIVYHEELRLPGDADILPALKASPLLRQVFTGERSVGFAFVRDGHE